MPATIPAGMSLPVELYRWYIMYVKATATTKLTSVAGLHVLPAGTVKKCTRQASG
jgi:hypothetical protein